MNDNKTTAQKLFGREPDQARALLAVRAGEDAGDGLDLASTLIDAVRRGLTQIAETGGVSHEATLWSLSYTLELGKGVVDAVNSGLPARATGASPATVERILNTAGSDSCNTVAIRAGIDAWSALDQAHCFIDSVQRALEQLAAAEGTMHDGSLWSFSYSLRIAAALVSSVQGGLQRHALPAAA